MKKMRQKVALLMSVLLLVTAIPFSAFAEGTSKINYDGEHVTFSQNEPTAASGSEVAFIAEPASGYRVTGFDVYEVRNDNSTVQDKVTKIGTTGNPDEYYFKMPTYDITIIAKTEALPFKSVGKVTTNNNEPERGTLVLRWKDVEATEFKECVAVPQYGQDGDEVLVVAQPKAGNKVKLLEIRNVTDGNALIATTSESYYVLNVLASYENDTIKATVTFEANDDPTDQKDYQVTLATYSEGTLSVDQAKHKAETEVTVSVTPIEGYHVAGVVYDKEHPEDAGDLNVSLYKSAKVGDSENWVFTMPHDDVTVKATFAPNAIEHYRVTWNHAGKVTVNGDNTGVINEVDENTEVVVNAFPATSSTTGAQTQQVKYYLIQYADGNEEQINTDANEYVFTMPSQDVNIYVEFENTAEMYDIVTDGAVENGTLTYKVGGAETGAAAQGSRVTITTTPDEKYVLQDDTIEVRDANNELVPVAAAEEGKFTFTMPASDVTVFGQFIRNIDYDGFTVRIEASVMGGNGNVRLGATKATPGNSVYFAIDPQPDYVLNTLSAFLGHTDKDKDDPMFDLAPVWDEDAGFYRIDLPENGSPDWDYHKFDKATVYASFKPADETLFNVNVSIIKDSASRENGDYQVFIDDILWEDPNNTPQAAEHQTVKIAATADKGYSVANIDTGSINRTINKGFHGDDAIVSFEMPAKDADVKVSFDHDYYTVTYVKNGTTANAIANFTSLTGKDTAYYDDAINVAVKYETGYKVTKKEVIELSKMKSVDIKSVEADEDFTFDMPEADAQVEVTVAPWDATLVYDKNATDSEGTMDSEAIQYNELHTLVVNAYTRTGYNFAGWATEPTGSVVYGNGAVDIKFITTKDDDTVTLYAAWLPIDYTLKFNDGEPVGSTTATGTMPDVDRKYDDTPVALGNGFSKEGYKFQGWSTTLGGEVEYDATTPYNNFTTVDHATVTLYAVWAPIDYTIEFDTKGAISTPDPLAMKFDTAKNIPSVPTKIGYQFKEWYCTETLATYSNAQSVKNLSKVDGSTVHFEARWTPNRYTVSFNPNGADVSGSMAAQHFTYDEAQPLTLNGYSRSNYIFAGWTDGQVTYDNGQNVINLTTINNGNVSLSAKWTAIKTNTGSTGGGGGGGGSVIDTTTSKSLTYSKFWVQGADGTWTVQYPAGTVITRTWFCDDAVLGNGQDVWYLLDDSGRMITAGLVQDASGNFYSIETESNGYKGSLRHKNGYYTINGEKVYIEFEQSHNGAFGAIKNQEAIDKLKAAYGVTKYLVSSTNCKFSSQFN